MGRFLLISVAGLAAATLLFVPVVHADGAVLRDAGVPGVPVQITAYGWSGDILATGPASLCSERGDLVTSMRLLEGSAFVQANINGKVYPIESVGGVDETAGLVRLGLPPGQTLPAADNMAPFGGHSPAVASARLSFVSTGGRQEAVKLLQVTPLPLTPDMYFIRGDSYLPVPGTAVYNDQGRLLGVIADRGEDGHFAILAGPDRVLGLVETRCVEQDLAWWSSRRGARWENSAQGVYLAAARVLLSGQPGDALNMLDRVAGKGTAYESEIQFTLGQCYLSEGLLYRAIMAFLDALGPASDPCAVYRRLAWAYSEAREYGQAEAACISLLENDPDNQWASMFMARLLNLQGRPEEAETFARKAVKLDPHNPCAQTELGFALAGQGGHGESIPHFREAVRMGEDTSRSYSGLGQAYLMVGRPLYAIVAFKQAVAHDSSGGDLWRRLARAYQAAGLDDQALEAYRMAVCTEPDNSSLACCLAKEYLERGMAREAVESLRGAVAKAPGNPWLHYYLGRAYAQCGQQQDAIRELQLLEGMNRQLARQLRLRIEPQG
jgi:tetratricopeptide (TPR) repeat protein